MVRKARRAKKRNAFELSLSILTLNKISILGPNVKNRLLEEIET